MLTEKKLRQLYAGYNNVSEETVNELVTYLFAGSTTATKISQATTAGLTIGSTGDKLAFYGGTPLVRGVVSSAVTTTPTADFTACIASITTLNTIVNDMRTRLGNAGLNLFNIV